MKKYHTTMITFLLPDSELDEVEAMALDNIQGLDYSRNLYQKHHEDRSARFCTYAVIKPTEANNMKMGFGNHYLIVELWTHATDLMSLAYFLRQHYSPELWFFVDYAAHNYQGD